MLPWSTKSNGGTGLDGTHSTVSIQGPGTVYDTSIAIRLTHWLSCIAPRYFWRGPIHLHEAIHHAQVHIQSILLGTWCLHIRPCALIGSPPRTGVHPLLPQVVEEQLNFHLVHGALARRHERCMDAHKPSLQIKLVGTQANMLKNLVGSHIALA